MPWLQLRLDTDPNQLAALEDRLLASGAAAVTLEDNADEALLEPPVGATPIWQQTRLTGLYPADTDMTAVLDHFSPELLSACRHRIEILEDKDWEREWMQHYQPMQFGQRLWVCPSWISPPDDGNEILLLDPGLAFGTGTHPTTAMCLEQLAALTLSGHRAVDYGCGSGILAVAALKLGAREVLAIDNDPQALAATRDNAGRNHIPAQQLQVALPGDAPTARWHGTCELVVANILAGPLAQLRDELCALLAPGGTLILAGLLEGQAQQLQQHYAAHLPLHTAAQQEEWVCLRGELP